MLFDLRDARESLLPEGKTNQYLILGGASLGRKPLLPIFDLREVVHAKTKSLASKLLGVMPCRSAKSWSDVVIRVLLPC